jgi:signal transduction histidine kinase
VRHAIEWSNGRVVYLSINGMPILNEHRDVDKVIFTIEDYTERKHQQDAIEAALGREKHLNKLKSNFISMVSHEFRTPLTVIMTSTEIIRRKVNIFTPEQLENRLNKITHQIVHLGNLLSEVTFINKSDLMGTETCHRVLNLPDFLEQIIDEIQSAFPLHKPIEAVLNITQPDLVIDDSLVQKIVVNLLSNAMKYSPDESTVQMICEADGQHISLIVKDEGIGIPQNDQADLFNEFHRARNVGTIPGTGLGLAIIKRAVDALGGEIHFESVETQGTTFAVTLPIEVNLPVSE